MRRVAGLMNQSDPGRVPETQAAAGGDRGWRQRMGEIALACAGSFAAEEGERLRELRELLVQAPSPGLVRGISVPSAERLDELIAVGAGQSAALAMLGAECGYLLSRGAGGQHLASVILPGADEETSSSGDTLALALIAALALALVDAGAGGGKQPRKESGPRLN